MPNDIDWRARADRFELALRTITKREGRFDRDHSKHAWNTIVDMSTVALDALLHEGLQVNTTWEGEDAS